MVFVKVRETYDIQTTRNKMTVIGIHTPKSDIIKQNFPGLLMQCKTYRPYSCDVVVACASVLPLDPQGVGLAEGDVAPEDVFNPFLYKAMTNQGMSQLEKRITWLRGSTDNEIVGSSADVDVDTLTTETDEFPLYYGLLSNSHGWKTAMPQNGLMMKNLVPLVYEVLASNGDNQDSSSLANNNPLAPSADGVYAPVVGTFYFRGNAKRMPMINTTTYGASSRVASGFNDSPANHEGTANGSIPAPQVMCGCIIVPPSRLHELFFRMTVEWTLEFSGIRPMSEVSMWSDVAWLGNQTHYQNYDYTSNAKAMGIESELTNDTALVDTNVSIKKVM